MEPELQEEDDKFVMGGTGKRIRFVERGGQSLEQLLGRNDPWSGTGCSRSNCLQCQHGGGEGGECQGESVLYEITCLKCKEIKKITSYVGETSRTGHARGDNHVQDLLHRREGKPLWEHSQEEHGGLLQTEDWKMVVIKRYRTALQRQIGEALEIERKGITNDLLLNSKSQLNRVRIPRLRVESVSGEDNEEEDKNDFEESDKVRRKLLRQNWQKTEKKLKKNQDSNFQQKEEGKKITDI